MGELTKQEAKTVEPSETFGWFDRMVDDWPKLFPFRRMLTFDWMPEQTIQVDEFRENGNLVIRAALPGIDPAKDVELTVDGGMLHIKAQRRDETTKTEEKGYLRRELHYGSFARTLPLPEGVATSHLTAGYKDGILEIRVPLPKAEATRKIPVTTS